MTNPETAALARIRQMADHWEQRLPEVIRTPAVVSALRAALEPAAPPAAPAAVAPPADGIRDQLLHAIDHAYTTGVLGYGTPEELLAAYDTSRAPADRAALRDRIRRAVCEAEGFTWNCEMQEPDEYGDVADAVLAVLPEPADRAAVLREAADAVFALEYDVMVGEEGDENLGSLREAWDVGTIHATQLLRRMADETATTETAAVDLPTLAAALDGLDTLIATSSRDWGQYHVDAWLWAVLCGWDCEEDHEHDELCEDGEAMTEMARQHGWDEATVAKARRYRAAVRAVAEMQPAAGARQDGAAS